jgi:hypothetical protein
MNNKLDFELPTEKTKAGDYDKVERLVITGHQGTGKTSTCAKLPNSLIIDLESGCKDHYEAVKIDVKELAKSNNITMNKALFLVLDKLAKEKASGGKTYDYVIFDGITALEKIVHSYATALFKNTVVGKGMVNKGTIINDVVTDVPESGWMWYFRAWQDLYERTSSLANKCTIYLAHTKQGSMMKAGTKLDANDLNLSGKAKLDLLRDVDACGTIWLDKDEVKISFKTNEKDLTTKSRCRHLNDAEFVLSKKDKNGNITMNWDKIFLDLKK